MEFQIVSHAGLLVAGSGVRLLCDPWILGSCYWRSWWNYPPVSRDLIDSLKPDYIYLTHLHWDHFQGPSLRKFGLDQKIIIPYSPDTRMLRDLRDMKFHNITELKHGCSLKLGDDFTVTSYQFNLFMDTALVVESEGVTLLNANDSKFMGEPLGQILRKHGKIDFTLRSHSSANSRLSYQVWDKPDEPVDDLEKYLKDFADFALASGCRYAIPFASNHCYLHRDVYHFNRLVQTPRKVADYFASRGVAAPEVKVMVSGDRWSSTDGFQTSDKDWFTDHQAHIAEYRDANAAKLEAYYAKEDKTKVTLGQMERYFDKFSRALPWPVRRKFEDSPIVYVLRAGERRMIFEVDLYRRTVRELDAVDDAQHPIQIHTSAFMMKQCMGLDLFSHLSISKRVTYRVTAAKKSKVVLLNLLFNFYEYEMLPLRRMLSWRFVSVWLSRWREWTLYARISAGLLFGRKFDMERYLKPAQSAFHTSPAASRQPPLHEAQDGAVPARPHIATHKPGVPTHERTVT